MAKSTVKNIVVARGETAAGHMWALSYPAWRWLKMTPQEQAAVIAEQTALMEQPRPEPEKAAANV